MMERTALTLALMLAACTAAYGQPSGQTQSPNANAEPQITALRRELVDASKRRDRAALERLIGEGFTFIHSNGATETKSTYIEKAAAGAFSVQQPDTDVETLDERLQIYDAHTGVLVRRGVLHHRGGGNDLALRNVEVYSLTSGRWQWVFGQSSPLPIRPQAAAIDRRRYDAYIGQYEVGPGRTLTVVRDGETLRALTTNRQPGELIPKSETEFVWFNPDMVIDAQILFITDDRGNVTHAAFRTNGQEAWRAKKIK